MINYKHFQNWTSMKNITKKSNKLDQSLHNYTIKNIFSKTTSARKIMHILTIPDRANYLKIHPDIYIC